MLKTVVLLHIFVETVTPLIFQDSLINTISKEQHLFQIEIFCNILNVFTVTFDRFNVYLLNKNINFFKKKQTYWPWTFEQSWGSCRKWETSLFPLQQLNSIQWTVTLAWRSFISNDEHWPQGKANRVNTQVFCRQMDATMRSHTKDTEEPIYHGQTLSLAIWQLTHFDKVQRLRSSSQSSQ